MLPKRVFPRIMRAASKGTGGGRSSKGYYSPGVSKIIDPIKKNVESGRRKQVKMDALVLNIYEKTRELFSTYKNFAYILKSKNPGVKIILGNLPSDVSGKEGLIHCKAIIIAKNLDLSEHKMRFSDGWAFHVEKHFRKNGSFPPLVSFRKNSDGAISLDGFKNVKKLIVDHYWEILNPK